ncbi:unnamed protein product [Protopolystoma xenopodis]|uniref:Uncharacterized protein n=1 Tax=Protopolystoma xenopodis TaxID=117903 RepID=A0A3S5FGA6_9PLAT|nr:unnamed protein product [Protopolystoma xenopodis]
MFRSRHAGPACGAHGSGFCSEDDHLVSSVFGINVYLRPPDRPDRRRAVERRRGGVAGPNACGSQQLDPVSSCRQHGSPLPH